MLNADFRESPSGHLGEYPEAALLHVHRLRLALQLARLLPPRAPAKSTVALIMTIKNSYHFFLVGWRGWMTPPPANKKHLPTRTANPTGSSSSGTTQKRPPRPSPACNARGRRCPSSCSSRQAHCRPARRLSARHPKHPLLARFCRLLRRRTKDSSDPTAPCRSRTAGSEC